MIDMTGGAKKDLEFEFWNFGNAPNLSGPWIAPHEKRKDRWLDLGILTGSVRISELDIRQTDEICTARGPMCHCRE